MVILWILASMFSLYLAVRTCLANSFSVDPAVLMRVSLVFQKSKHRSDDYGDTPRPCYIETYYRKKVLVWCL